MMRVALNDNKKSVALMPPPKEEGDDFAKQNGTAYQNVTKMQKCVGRKSHRKNNPCDIKNFK